MAWCTSPFVQLTAFLQHVVFKASWLPSKWHLPSFMAAFKVASFFLNKGRASQVFSSIKMASSSIQQVGMAGSFTSSSGSSLEAMASSTSFIQVFLSSGSSRNMAFQLFRAGRLQCSFTFFPSPSRHAPPKQYQGSSTGSYHSIHPGQASVMLLPKHTMNIHGWARKHSSSIFNASQ